MLGASGVVLMGLFVRGRGVGAAVAPAMARGVVCICTAALSIAAVASAVPGGAGWGTEQLPSSVASRTFQLYGVACPSVTTCTAFGAYGGDLQRTLLIRSKGAVWSRQQAPTPPTVPGGMIDSAALACPASAACIAVGSYDNRAYESVPFAEAWDGRRWRLHALPHPRGANLDLMGVSCSSRNACMAVGDEEPGQNSTYAPDATLAERWDGKEWTIESTPNLPGGSELNAVSCVSHDDECTAVGDSDLSGTTMPLVEVWNGTSWSIQETQPPRSGISGYLEGVSCTSRSACVAVGYGSVGQRALIERSQGARWSIMAASNPRHRSGELDGVSCASRNACTAVGYTVERWNGRRWSIQQAPTPGNRHFTAVSCPSTTACTAVGSGENPAQSFGFVERWTVK